MSIISAILSELFGAIGGGIKRADELYTSRVNTANANRGKNAFLRNLPVVIICGILILLLFLPKRTK